jgi:hypothetical protein
MKWVNYIGWKGTGPHVLWNGKVEKMSTLNICLQCQHSRKCDNVDSLWNYIYTALHWTPANGKWKVRTCMYEGTGKVVSYQAYMTVVPLVRTSYRLSSFFVWVGCSSVSNATLMNWSICLYPSHSYSLIGQNCSSALVLMQTPVCPVHT